MLERLIVQVDDTVGVLAGGRYYSRESVAAVTLGMGTNVVYVDSAQAVEKWPGKLPQSSELVRVPGNEKFCVLEFPGKKIDP